MINEISSKKAFPKSNKPKEKTVAELFEEFAKLQGLKKGRKRKIQTDNYDHVGIRVYDFLEGRRNKFEETDLRYHPYLGEDEETSEDKEKPKISFKVYENSLLQSYKEMLRETHEFTFDDD